MFCLTNVYGADERLVEINVMAFTTALMFWEHADVLGMLTAVDLTIWVHGVRYFVLGFVKTALYFGRYFGDH